MLHDRRYPPNGRRPGSGAHDLQPRSRVRPGALEPAISRRQSLAGDARSIGTRRILDDRRARWRDRHIYVSIRARILRIYVFTGLSLHARRRFGLRIWRVDSESFARQRITPARVPRGARYLATVGETVGGERVHQAANRGRE